MQPTFFNRYMRQLGTLALLLILVILVIRELYVFLPGLLGAITAYILSRNSYFQLVYHRKWRKGWTAGLYLLIFFLIPALLIYISIALLEKELQHFF